MKSLRIAFLKRSLFKAFVSSQPCETDVEPQANECTYSQGRDGIEVELETRQRKII
jgi:hypothetical protein